MVILCVCHHSSHVVSPMYMQLADLHERMQRGDAAMSSMLRQLASLTQTLLQACHTQGTRADMCGMQSNNASRFYIYTILCMLLS